MKHIQLQKQLSQFGLNPQHWVVQQMGGRAYAVRHYQDQQVYFWGKTTQKQDQVKWKKLSVAI